MSVPFILKCAVSNPVVFTVVVSLFDDAYYSLCCFDMNINHECFSTYTFLFPTVHCPYTCLFLWYFIFASYCNFYYGVEVVISAKLSDNILAHSFHFRCWDLSRRGRRGGTWWWKVGTSKKKKAEESNGKLPLRTCPGYSIPEPYQSPDWTLVSVQTGPRAEYQ